MSTFAALAIGAAVAGVLGMVLLFTWSPKKKAPTPNCTISDLPSRGRGRVRVTVRARGEQIVAPISGRRCVFYRLGLAAYGHVARSPNMVQWEPNWFPTERGHTGVVVSDHSGRAALDLDGAEVELRASREQVPLGLAPADLIARQRLEDLIGENASRVFVEEVLLDGDTVLIEGAGLTEPDPDGVPDEPHRGTVATRVRIVGSTEKPVRVFDQ